MSQWITIAFMLFYHWHSYLQLCGIQRLGKSLQNTVGGEYTGVQGWGSLNQFSPFHYFSIFSTLIKQMLGIEHHVYIWQVSPQLSCGDTCQIWMWFKEYMRYFCKIKKILFMEKLTNGASVTPTPATHKADRHPIMRSHEASWLGVEIMGWLWTLTSILIAVQLIHIKVPLWPDKFHDKSFIQ